MLASHFQEVNRRVWRRQKGTSDRGEGGGASPGARLQGGGCSLWDPQPREVPLRGPARRAGGSHATCPGPSEGALRGWEHGVLQPRGGGGREVGREKERQVRAEGWVRAAWGAQEARRLLPGLTWGPACPRTPRSSPARITSSPSWSLSLSPSGVSTGRRSAPLISPCCPRPGRERPPGSGPRHPRFTPAGTAGPGTQGSSASVGPWPRPCGRRRRRPP